jgi:hypothetical protein
LCLTGASAGFGLGHLGIELWSPAD